MVFAGIITRGKGIVAGKIVWIGVVVSGRAVAADFWQERKIAGFKHLFRKLVDQW